MIDHRPSVKHAERSLRSERYEDYTDTYIHTSLLIMNVYMYHLS